MEFSISLDDIPHGVSLVAVSKQEFRVDHLSDKEIYETMGQAKMAGRRLLRTRPSLGFVDVFHHIVSDAEFTTEEVVTIEKVIAIDL